MLRRALDALMYFAARAIETTPAAIGRDFRDLEIETDDGERWPEPVANPPHRARIHGAPPILLVNATHDPSTPYPWAHDLLH
jgi:acetyl esterase/lipase